MDVWMFVLGVILLLVAVVDLLWTVLWVEGGQGFLTSRLTTWTWRGYKRVVPRGRDRILGLAGPMMTILTLLTWLLLLWGGWVLVFSSDPAALRDTRNATPPNLAGIIYYVAYSMFTMGNGDFTPVGDVWQIATALTTASGMLSVTLFISYIISVTGAVVQKRSFANQVQGLGDTPADVLANAWDGRGFPGMHLQIQSLTTQMGVVTEQHLAYPILHYYHASTRSKSSALAVAKLDEVLTLLSAAVKPEMRPPPSILRSGRSGVRTYLGALKKAFISPAPDAPPPPDLQPLRDADIPLDENALRDALSRNEKRRRLLLAAVTNDGWTWEELRTPNPE